MAGFSFHPLLPCYGRIMQFRFQTRDFSLEGGDAPVALLKRARNVLRFEALRNVFRTVGVPRRHSEQDCARIRGFFARGDQLVQQRWIVPDHARFAPDLHALAMLIVDQKQMRLRILLEIAERDELPVAARIREADGLVIEDVQKSRWTAAMLDVGLAHGIRSAEKHAGLRRNELRVVRSARRFPTFAFYN